MATYTANGGKFMIAATSGTAASSAFGYLSASVDSGQRAEIDVTSTLDTRRRYIAGFADEPTIEIEANLDSSNLTLAVLDTLKESCSASELIWYYESACSTPTAKHTWCARLTNYTLSAGIDEVHKVNMTWRIDTTPGLDCNGE